MLYLESSASRKLRQNAGVGAEGKKDCYSSIYKHPTVFVNIARRRDSAGRLQFSAKSGDGMAHGSRYRMRDESCGNPD